jgi:FkbM family methyltransferase
MRQLIRRVLDTLLAPLGLEVRRKHDSEQIICAVQFATVIDGGANVGGYAAKIRAAMPAAEIHAFEPTPDLFRGLQQRFAADAKIACYDNALSDKSEQVTFHISDNPYASSLLEDTETSASPSKAVTVQAIALDDWAREHEVRRPALLKLDIEGNELSALRGAEELLKQIDYVELETTFVKARRGQPEFRDILNFLNDRGFDFIDIFPGIVDPTTHRSTWADAVFQRR